LKVSKDGVKFYDIDDGDDSVAAAKAKGYQEYLPMTKNGKDVFNVLATDDSYKAATDKGYKDVGMFNFQNKEDAPKIGTGQAAARGVAQGAAGGFADELSGLAGAVVNPTNSDKGFGDRYRDSRDYARGVDKAAQEQHPVVSFAGNVAGGVGAGALLGSGAATLKGAAGLGAAYGLGGSDADLTKPSVENIEQAAKDTAVGGVTGAAGYGAGKLVGAGIRSAAAPKAAYEALARGADAGAEAAPFQNIPGLGQASRLWGAVKGAIGERGEQEAAKGEVSAIANQAREGLAGEVQAPPSPEAAPLKIKRLQDIQTVGNGKSIDKFSDDEAILAALMDKGDNPTKRWVAEKAATLQPGQVDQDQYAKVLGMGPEARTTAREFDPREAAKALKPTVEDVQGLFKSARDQRYGALQDAARQGFTTEQGTPVLGELEGAIADARKLNSIPGSVRGVLDDVHGMVHDGTGTKLQGLTPGAWGDVPPAEQFNRLQQARQLLDQQVKWSGREGHTQAESVLKGLRGSIDDALKTSPEKLEADNLYRNSKDVEGKFFGATEFRNPSGGIDVDEGKLSRLLGNTDQANRFKSALSDMSDFADHPDLAPEFKDKAKSLVAGLQGHMDTMDQKRSLGALRQANGPSSPAIERLGSVTGGNGLVQDAVRSPAGFTNQVDQFNKTLRGKLGKSFEQLSGGDKAAATKYFLWLKKNPDVGQATADNMFAKFFGGGQ
jgi:hypothetical protein